MSGRHRPTRAQLEAHITMLEAGAARLCGTLERDNMESRIDWAGLAEWWSAHKETRSRLASKKLMPEHATGLELS